MGSVTGTLPPARYLTLSWAIEVDHGGMTSALLRRSRMFAHASGTTVDVLTFADDHDYSDVERQLRARGELDDQVRLLNLWSWIEGTSGRPGIRTRARIADDGDTTLEVDHLRADGSVLVTDRRDVDHPGSLGGRRVTLRSENGEIVHEWGSIWGLYRYWLDQLHKGERTVMIADSKPIAEFLATYRRRNVLTGHVIHGSHLGDGPGGIRESRRGALDRLADFDLAVVLTERQARDIQNTLGTAANLAVVPNAVDIPATITLDRAREHGIVLASLDSRKRVGHAIAAAIEVGEPVKLDIYGDGPEHDKLTKLVAETDRIHLHGHEAGAARHLLEASFLLLTSTSEGSPLVIAEAMAAGCIPIAYDIRYGPGDLIIDGVNGYLAPAGDPHALADRIRALQQLPDEDVTKMRLRAREAAERLGEAAVLESWNRELAHAWRRKLNILPSLRRKLRRRIGSETPRPLTPSCRISTHKTSFSSSVPRAITNGSRVVTVPMRASSSTRQTIRDSPPVH